MERRNEILDTRSDLGCFAVTGVLMKPPNKIYVQWYGEDKPAKDDDTKPAEVTWSKDRIYKHDIVYVRIKRRRKS